MQSQIDLSMKIRTIEEVKHTWDNFAELYSLFDNSMQTFYYTLLTMLKIDSAKNIL